MSVTTRSGRTIKKPERYEPVEQVTDDFSDSAYDSEFSDDDSDCESIVTESTMLSDDEDENGNLKGFVVDSDEESDPEEEEEEEEEEEVHKKTKKRKKVKCEETA